MSLLIIPTGDDPFSEQTTTFEGVTFTLSFAYNQRCCCWYLSLADANGVDVYNGVKLTCGIPLFRKCADPRRPAGDLVVLSSTTDNSPPQLEDLVAGSGRCTLYYVTSDWMAALKAGNVAALLAQVANNATASQTSTYGQV